MARSRVSRRQYRKAYVWGPQCEYRMLDGETEVRVGHEDVEPPVGDVMALDVGQVVRWRGRLFEISKVWCPEDWVECRILKVTTMEAH